MITVFGWSLRAPSQATRFVVLAALSVALMVLDHRGQQLARIRGVLSVLAIPVHYVAAVPGRVIDGVSDLLAGERALREANSRLRAANEELRVKLLQFEALEQENARLRNMLGSAQRVAEQTISAEILEASPEPFSRHILLARGERHGVRPGQPVIDAHGIMGQITQVAPYTSRATLITDAGHAIPVLVNRSGLRALAFGTGDAETLKVPYLTAGADIREGDLLVSSGMGGSFPPDYPVARVTRIVNDPNEAFLDIRAKPTAQLNHGKQVMVIHRLSGPAPRPNPSPKATVAPKASAPAAKAVPPPAAAVPVKPAAVPASEGPAGASPQRAPRLGPSGESTPPAQ
jgi:rod shape-determining protein MreC